MVETDRTTTSAQISDCGALNLKGAQIQNLIVQAIIQVPLKDLARGPPVQNHAWICLNRVAHVQRITKKSFVVEEILVKVLCGIGRTAAVHCDCAV